MSPLPGKLQATLENVYRIEGPARVADFRIGAGLMDLMLGKGASSGRREALLVAHDGEYTDVGVYIAENIVARAQGYVDRAGRGSIDAFCVALEGVSHFLYFTFCGHAFDRPVSMIELELQAEVDKFLVLRVLGVGDEDLVDRLFSRVTIDDSLSAEEQERYRVANRQARRYARWLDRAFREGRGADALADARALYRKSLPAKLSHIARAA